MGASGGGYEANARADRRGVHGGATTGQELGVESGSRKRQAIVCGDSKTSVGNKDLEVASKDSERISVEIESLRSQLYEDVKELGYCEENQKLKVQLALKEKETQCLRKQNEELQAKCKCLLKKVVEILENQIHTKRAHLLQFERLNITKEIPSVHLEENKTRSHEPSDEESSSKLIDTSVAEKNGINIKDSSSKAVKESFVQKNSIGRKADLEQSMQFELEVAKLDAEIQSRMEMLSEMLELTIFSEELGRDLSKKERESNTELQEARKEMIMYLEDMLTGQTTIGIKRMGELDEKTFQYACKKKYGDDNYQDKAAVLVSTWQGEIKKPSWYPFKVIYEFNEEAKEVIDDNDTKLKLLQTTFGDDVCNAVKTALTEINQYNPAGRQVVPELWNFSKGRKATMKEVLRYMFRRTE